MHAATAVVLSGTHATDPSDQPLRVNVRRIAALSDEEDAEVDGVYQVHFFDCVSALPLEKRAAIALDIFHSSIAIGTLDDFDIAVVDHLNRAVAQDEAHESYSASDDGSVEKIADYPVFVHGEDRGLSADELDARYNPDGDGEHPRYTRADWRDAVSNHDTSLGYWAWLEEQISGEEEGQHSKASAPAAPDSPSVTDEHQMVCPSRHQDRSLDVAGYA